MRQATDKLDANVFSAVFKKLKIVTKFVEKQLDTFCHDHTIEQSKNTDRHKQFSQCLN